MTEEIRETKLSELEDLDDMIDELKVMIRLKKKRRKELRKELDYTVKNFDPNEVNIKEVIKQI